MSQNVISDRCCHRCSGGGHFPSAAPCSLNTAIFSSTATKSTSQILPACEVIFIVFTREGEGEVRVLTNISICLCSVVKPTMLVHGITEQPRLQGTLKTRVVQPFLEKGAQMKLYLVPCSVAS